MSDQTVMDEDARAQPHLSEQESNEPTQEFLTFRLGD